MADDAPLIGPTEATLMTTPLLDLAELSRRVPVGKHQVHAVDDVRFTQRRGRCPIGIPRCGTERPALRRFPGGREAACHRAEAS